VDDTPLAAIYRGPLPISKSIWPQIVHLPSLRVASLQTLCPRPNPGPGALSPFVSAG
jgi:hypothetical protein